MRLLHPFAFSILFKMKKKSFKLPAFAKINWFLNVLGKREDGFHEYGGRMDEFDGGFEEEQI